jgi:antibiotic biosynthesis monooxygenase (ABM) superfamily enzyme
MAWLLRFCLAVVKLIATAVLALVIGYFALAWLDGLLRHFIPGR